MEVERYHAETLAAANDDRSQLLRALSAELAAVEDQVGSSSRAGVGGVGSSAAPCVPLFAAGRRPGCKCFRLRRAQA